MTEAEFLRIVRAMRPRGVAIGPLDLPLEALPFDSLDLVVLRSALEAELGCALTDEKFTPGSTLRDLFNLVQRRCA
jgi:acyl carrier protein